VCEAPAAARGNGRRSEFPARPPSPTRCDWSCGHSRGPGARLCAKHQPQRVGTERRTGIAMRPALPTRCDWSCGHSRAPVIQGVGSFHICCHVTNRLDVP